MSAGWVNRQLFANKFAINLKGEDDMSVFLYFGYWQVAKNSVIAGVNKESIIRNALTVNSFLLDSQFCTKVKMY